MLTTTSVRKIFEKGGPEKLKIMQTNRKICPLRISPFSCPKLDEDQEKGVHPDFVRLCAQTICPSCKGGGGHVAISHTFLCKLYYSGEPKGLGHSTMPPSLNTPLLTTAELGQQRRLDCSSE